MQAAEFSGGGIIRADGGNAGSQGNGGGGRIALVATNSAGFGNLGLQARGGTADTYGGAGTIYLKDTNAVFGRLIVANNGKAATTDDLSTGNRTTRLPAAQTYIFDSITVTNAGWLEIIPNAVLDLSAGCTLNGDTNSYLVMSGGQLNLGAGFTVTNFNIAQRGTNTITINGTLTLGTNAVLTHYANRVAAMYHWLSMTVTNDLVVEPGGKIMADGLGYGPNQGIGSWTRGGGAHGGQGGNTVWVENNGGRTTWGSITNPATMGGGFGSAMATDPGAACSGFS